MEKILERVDDEKKVGSVLERLIKHKKATEVAGMNYLVVYSVQSPEIAVVARTGTDGYRSGTTYTAIGRSEDIKEFEDLLQYF